MMALAPYFSAPVDLAILERYKLMRTGQLDPTKTSTTSPIILEREPVDEDHVARHGINVGRMADGSGWGASRGSFGFGPSGWIDTYQDRLKVARAEFTRARPDQK